MVRILVIDDDGVIQTFLSRALQKEYEVFVASDGEEGLKQAGQLKPAMIICDWMMPIMDGLTLVERIKQDGFLKHTPFLMATSEGNYDRVLEAIKGGVSDYVVKPFTATILEEKLKKIISAL